MFRAYVVYNGAGDNYQKHGVYALRAQAVEAAAAMSASIWAVNLPSKYELETLIEDNLTDAQAAEFKE